MENVELYYENLFKWQDFDLHPFHTEIINKVENYAEDRLWENLAINAVPNSNQVAKAVKGRKNNKATTDIKNEIIKGSGISMVEILTILIQEFWKTEEVPAQWNEGLIMSIWKGKVDREVLSNFQGITISSSFGMIMEEILNHRILKTISFTQAQGGRRKGSSTCDHVFIIKAIVSYAKKKKKKIILTFYDVQKAYDRAEVDDMMESRGQGQSMAFNKGFE